ncbi:MAG TPA: L-threonylcarbamoyladenylate synthase [Terriglobales bacterium]|nr:L-threonylcarbamoyladenylate synthase [Terriglobales bacterium]
MNETRAEPSAAALTALKRGEVIVFPTETLYGLGADALNFAAVEKVFQLKDREPNNPIPVLIDSREMLQMLAADVPQLAEQLIAVFWPGPLTIVLPARKNIPRPLVNTRGGVGVRLSSEPIATALVRALGRPLTATSANPSGQAPARTVEEAKNYFAGQIAIFIDGGELTSRTASSVVEIIGDQLKIIRAGEVSREQLETALGAGRVIT